MKNYLILKTHRWAVFMNEKNKLFNMQSQKEDQLKILLKYFIDKFSLELLLNQRVPKNDEEKRAKYYFDQLADIANLFDGLLNYGIYFQYFYPATEKISEESAIEYHIRSYIQDIYILKERLFRIHQYSESKLTRNT